MRPGLTLLVDGDQPVHLVGFGDVQLSSLHHLRELRALVEGAAQTRLPGRRVVLTPFRQLPFKLRPRLQEDTSASDSSATWTFCLFETAS